MNKKPTLSVIIITKNEANCLRRCLDSVSWADEIVVVDSGSEDTTLAIAREYTDKVLVKDWQGFGKQKNRALVEATGDWIFSIDADEWVEESLRLEILSQIQKKNSSFHAFWIPRRNRYLGHWVHYGDVGRDQVIRLFKRGSAQFTEDIVHESLRVYSGKIGRLQEALCHESYVSIEALLDRMNWYTTLSADIRFRQGQQGSLSKAVLHGTWAFVKAYFFRLGFLDGKIGFIVAVSSAESSYYRYLKLAWRRN